MLKLAKIVCFVATTKPAAAKKFYRGVLGLSLVEDSPFALVFDLNGTMLRMQKGQKVSPPPYPTLDREINDIQTMKER